MVKLTIDSNHGFEVLAERVCRHELHGCHWSQTGQHQQTEDGCRDGWPCFRAVAAHSKRVMGLTALYVVGGLINSSRLDPFASNSALLRQYTGKPAAGPRFLASACPWEFGNLKTLEMQCFRIAAAIRNAKAAADSWSPTRFS